MADLVFERDHEPSELCWIISKEYFTSLGGVFGKKATEKYDSSLNLESVLDSMSNVWVD
jgi:hypothetical protein